LITEHGHDGFGQAGELRTALLPMSLAKGLLCELVREVPW